MEIERTDKRCFHTLRNGASIDVGAPSRVYGSGLVMGGKLWRNVPKSIECKVKLLTSQMQKRDVRAPYLSAGFDNSNTHICGIGMKIPIES